ncbi:MAG TPA: DUF2142 domain-containing protein, partial [Anaerolineales bacterium]|nr:DUF2142 domain-containing protein [Anaerolineales bacterium]
PALPVFYACRFASLLSYMLLVWLAIRLIPFGKWILLVLAVTPMALYQAATISPDAISNGIGFLFVAGCLQAGQFKEIRWKEAGYLIILIALLFLAKLNLLPLILLPFLLILPSRFTGKGIYFFLLSMTAILLLVEVGGWNMIASRHSDPLLANEANPAAQLSFILGHPIAFIQTLLKDLLTHGWIYFQGWINGYGYYYWTPPLSISLFFLLSLAFALLIDAPVEQVNQRYRILFIFLFVASYLATVVSLYVSFTPVGLDQVLGVQGRYFIPLVLPLFLALSSLLGTKKISLPSSRWIIIFLTIALSLNVLGILFSFHVPCGATFYQTGLCYRPLVRDFPSNAHLSQPISSEISLSQEIRVKCNGLAELNVLVTPSTPEDQGTTRFILQDPLKGRTIMDTSVANAQISREEWYPLHFEPDWQSAGKQYVLSITAVNPSTGGGLKFLYTTQSEFNLGNLSTNGQLMQEDIVLQYGCITGLRKIWLTGKP